MSNGNGTPTDLQGPLARMWRDVYRKAAGVAEGRTTELLKGHVYFYHPDGVGPFVDEAGDTMTGNLLMRAQIVVFGPAGGHGTLVLRGDLGATLQLEAPAGRTVDVLLFGGGTQRWVLQQTAAYDLVLTRWNAGAAGPIDSPLIVRYATGAVELAALTIGGTPAATLTTSTAAPAGAANSLWFNPSETA